MNTAMNIQVSPAKKGLLSSPAVRKFLRHLPIHLILITGAVVMITPFIWMLATSFKDFAESVRVPPTFLPTVWHPENYVQVLRLTQFPRYYLNSIIVTIGRTVGQVFLCSLAAYSFARLKFPGKSIIFFLMLSVLMVPTQIVIIPAYLMMSKFNWLDSYYALIIPGIFSAFGTFLLRQFFLSIPSELDDAAKIDGASFFRIYWQIYLPLSKSALASLAVFTINNSWNDFLWPLIVTSSEEMRVLSVGLATFQGQHATEYPFLMAGAVMATAPIILAFLLLQRQFIAGIALTGINR